MICRGAGGILPNVRVYPEMYLTKCSCQCCTDPLCALEVGLNEQGCGSVQQWMGSWELQGCTEGDRRLCPLGVNVPLNL